MGEILHWFKWEKFRKAATLADVNYHVFIEVNGPAPPALFTRDISLNIN